jgi:hypothetical protein
MKLEEGLQKYLDEALTTDNIYSCEISFYRQVTREELDYMNEQLEGKGAYIICFNCDTCAERTDGIEPYHIDRMTFRR